MEEVENQDQVQQDSPENTGPEVIRRDEPEESVEEDQASEEQSETTEDVEEAKSQVFKDHMGRELTPEQLHEEYLKTQSYITQLEKANKERKETAKEETSKAIAENEYLQNVDPNVKEAILKIVEPAIEQRIQAKEAEEQRKAEDEAFVRRIEELEEKYPGGNGLPKFDKTEIIKAMQEDGEIFNPETMYKQLHWDKIVDYHAKQAMKGKSSDTKTEDTRGSPRKPQKNTPKTWEEAGRAALSR